MELGQLFYQVLPIGVVFVALLLITARFSYKLLGTWFTPLTFYYLRWFLFLFTFLLNLADYDPVAPLTWIVIAGSVIAFSAGAIPPMLAVIRRPLGPLRDASEDLRRTADSRRFHRTLGILYFAGVAILAVYFYSIHRDYGLMTLFTSPHVIRANIALGNVPLGFQYFYVLELVPVLCVIAWKVFPEKRGWGLILMGLTAAASLILTTGKVNLIKVVVWSVVVLALLNLNRLSALRVARLATAAVVGGLLLFTVLSDWGSEAFESTAWYRHVPDAGLANPLMHAYIYNTGQVPTLDQLLHDPEVEFHYGKLTFLPISKVVSRISPDFETPSHIGKFYDIPMPFNVATYLDVMYKDFGIAGTLIIPFLLGWMSSASYVRFLRGPVTLGTLLLNSIFALWIFASVSAASYIKPVYWFQILLAFVLSRGVARTRAPEEPPRAPLT